MKELIKSPLPGMIREVRVGIGDIVNIGDPLVVIESMKMLNEIRSDFSGVVSDILVSPESFAAIEQNLIEIEKNSA
jgi:biotin carboxyl carrier protein